MCYTTDADRFKAMSHPVRLHILDMLRRGETCVCHIEAALGKRQAYVSQQLMTLREAGLVRARREGLQVYYHLHDAPTLALLQTLYGPLDTPGLETIDGCACPECSLINVTEIS